MQCHGPKSSRMPAFAATELTPLYGVKFTGLDVSQPLARSAAAELLRALDTQGVVVLRGQKLSAKVFMAFARSLGEPVAHPLNVHARPGMPELMVHTNITENGNAIGYSGTERQWRMEGAQFAEPYRASLAYAVEIPVRDGTSLGDTQFCNTAAAYDALDPALRRQLIGLRAVHPYGAGRKRRATPYFADSGLTQIFKRGVEHLIVRTHPRTRRKCLYVSQGSTSHICGMNDRDSANLLAQLYRHLAQPQFVYQHQWKVGDVVLWDNAVIQYRTADDYEPLRRLHYRTQLKGV